MKIDHIAIYVNNLEGAKDFFIKYFGGKPNELYHNPRTGLRTYILTFDDGARLELMTRPNMDDAKKSEFRTGFIHLSFAVGSKYAVDELTKTLLKDGYRVLSGPRTTGDGYYESCIEGFEGNLIEITV